MAVLPAAAGLGAVVAGDWPGFAVCCCGRGDAADGTRNATGVVWGVEQCAGGVGWNTGPFRMMGLLSLIFCGHTLG